MTSTKSPSISTSPTMYLREILSMPLLLIIDIQSTLLKDANDGIGRGIRFFKVYCHDGIYKKTTPDLSIVKRLGGAILCRGSAND